MGVESLFRKIDEVRWELPKGFKPGMRVPCAVGILRIKISRAKIVS